MKKILKKIFPAIANRGGGILNKKRKITLTIIGVLLLTSITVGVSYAYYTSTIKVENEVENEVEVKATALPNIKMEYGNTMNFGKNILPGTILLKPISVTATCQNEAKTCETIGAELKITITDEEKLFEGYIKWSLFKMNDPEEKVEACEIENIQKGREVYAISRCNGYTKEKDTLEGAMLVAKGTESATVEINNITGGTFDKYYLFVEYINDEEKGQDNQQGKECSVRVDFITGELKDASDIKIKVLTEEYGPEIEINMEYGNNITKEYKIGETGEYQSYTDKIKIKTNDVLHLANEDGSITIYARGINEAGTERIISERIKIIDLDAPKEPEIIQESNGYPILTEYGVKMGSEVYIQFDERDDIDNYYSTDKGATWNLYIGPFEPSETIMAKSVKKKSGLTVTSTKKIVVPGDALGPKAYDGDEETNEFFNRNDIKIAVSEEMWNRKVWIKTNRTSGSDAGEKANCYDKEGKLIDTIAFINTSDYAKTKTATIPANTKMMVFSSQSNTFYEIRPENTPVISNTKAYPTLTEYGVESGYNEITIGYYGSSVQRLYKINNGEWQEYEDKKIRLKIGETIYAKGIDKNGKETYVTSSYKAVLPGDALGPKAYDGDEETNEFFNRNDIKIAVSEEMWNRKVWIKTNRTSGSDAGERANCFDKEGKLVGTIAFINTSDYAKTKTATIPANTKMMVFSSQSNTFYEIRPENTPVIKQANIYSHLKVEGMQESIIKVHITYLPTLSQKLYSIDNGATWNEYTEPFEIKAGTVVKAKGILEDGTETSIASHTVTAISEALSLEAYDSNKETYASIAASTSKVFTLSEDLKNKRIRFFLNSTPASDAYIKVYDKANNELESIALTSQVSVLNIPESGYKVVIYSGSSVLNITEVSLREELNIEKEKNPIIEISDVEWNTNKGIEITYPEGNYKKEYSIDNGMTWLEYTEPINIQENGNIFARVVENGKVIGSSSFTVTKIDNEDPTIELDLNEEIYEKSNLRLPTSYSVGISGGTPICKIGDTEYTSTKNLDIGTYTIECSITNGLGKTANVSKEITVVESSGIINQMSGITETGYYNILSADENYPTHVYVFDGNQEWTENKVFGDANDVANPSSDAKNMVVVKVKGNLTISDKVTVTSFSNSYGGPKGFMLYVEGTLTNNGTIHMTGKGAKAAGQNVYLWKDIDGKYATVPLDGATGGSGTKSDGDKGINGQPGSNGENRATGGGGGGTNVYSSYSSSTTIGGAGSSGTSYSGGSGGGSSNHGWGTTSNGNAIGTTGGSCYGVNGQNPCQTGVGILTGIVTGTGVKQTNLGTGGLLLIYSDQMINNGIIQANGISPAASTNNPAYTSYGGASGGGSINVFYHNLIETGTIEANGGTGRLGYTAYSNRTATSGSGGNGSVTLTKVGE